MKKIIALFALIAVIFTLSACASNSGAVGNTTTPAATEDPNLINWKDIPDGDIVGAWKDTSVDSDELILFTPECDIRLVMGSATISADIKFGVDGNGVKSAYTESSVLYGQWTYTVSDGILTVTYPDEERVFTFKAADYTPVTLVADENFTPSEELVGKWENKEYSDSYTFTDDGYITYEQHYDDDVNVYDSEVLYTYTVDGGSITMTYIADNTEHKEIKNTVEYSIDGDKLIIGGFDYVKVTD